MIKSNVFSGVGFNQCIVKSAHVVQNMTNNVLSNSFLTPNPVISFFRVKIKKGIKKKFAVTMWVYFRVLLIFFFCDFFIFICFFLLIFSLLSVLALYKHILIQQKSVWQKWHMRRPTTAQKKNTMSYKHKATKQKHKQEHTHTHINSTWVTNSQTDYKLLHKTFHEMQKKLRLLCHFQINFDSL